jgi:hypothetical protein
MKYYMDKTIRECVEPEYEAIKNRYQYLSRSQVIAGILSRYENKGHASRFLRRDGNLGWRATDKLRAHLYEQEQDAIENDNDLDW